MAALLTHMVAGVSQAQHAALEKAAVIVETEAKAEIGNYQGAAGPFAAWAPLKPETIARKVNGDTPLLETGEMRDSIEHMVQGNSAYVGSNNEKALWQENGTSRGIPPRSFLGGAAVRKSPDVVAAVGQTIQAYLVSGGTKTAIP